LESSNTRSTIYDTNSKRWDVQNDKLYVKGTIWYVGNIGEDSVDRWTVAIIWIVGIFLFTWQLKIEKILSIENNYLE
jgi:hypothetical protein